MHCLLIYYLSLVSIGALFRRQNGRGRLKCLTSGLVQADSYASVKDKKYW
jgi:hypothetical protein